MGLFSLNTLDNVNNVDYKDDNLRKIVKFVNCSNKDIF